MLAGTKHGWWFTVLQSRVNPGPASFSVSCLQCWFAPCVPLPLISLRDDLGFDSWQPEFHHCKHTDVQMAWRAGVPGHLVCVTDKRNRLTEPWLNSHSLSLWSKAAWTSGESPAGKREPRSTPAQIMYRCLPNTQTAACSLVVPALLRRAFSPDLSNSADALFTTWFPCPISCFTYRFPSPSDLAKHILFIFFPWFPGFPVIPLLCFQRPQGLLVPDLCLSLQRTLFISPLQPRPVLRGERSITQLLIWEVFHISKRHSWMNNEWSNIRWGRWMDKHCWWAQRELLYSNEANVAAALWGLGVFQYGQSRRSAVIWELGL